MDPAEATVWALPDERHLKKWNYIKKTKGNETFINFVR